MSRRLIIDELEFAVPYGNLAAKSWHEDTDEGKRVLALHGWMDNAGSFDNLVPELKYKNGLYVVALDLPGHGRSSQLPPGGSYSDVAMVMEIRRFLQELEWTQFVAGSSSNDQSDENDKSTALDPSPTGADPGRPRKKFTIMGHSLGAVLALCYASLFPEDVEELVVIDFIKARTPPAEHLLLDIAETIDNFIDLTPSQKAATLNKQRQDKGQVVVSQEAAIVATIDAHKFLGTLTRDDARCLLQRSTVAVSSPPNSVIYSRDHRLQWMLNMRENFQVQQLLFSRVNCHVLIIAAKQGMYASDALFRDRLDEMQEFYKQRANTFHLYWVEGDHYLHMNKYKKTAAVINKYFESRSVYSIEDERSRDI